MACKMSYKIGLKLNALPTRSVILAISNKPLKPACHCLLFWCERHGLSCHQTSCLYITGLHSTVKTHSNNLT